MSLGIAWKAPDGVVLAADSRMTLFRTGTGPQGQPLLMPAHFDNATKLLSVPSQDHVGALSFGVATIGQQDQRTPHSFLPEFEATLPKKRLAVRDFASRLSSFLLTQWEQAKMPAGIGDMIFFVAGYDPDAIHGSIFEFLVPSRPEPAEKLTEGAYGAVWGGQRAYVDRLVNGWDERTLTSCFEYFDVPPDRRDEAALAEHLSGQLAAPIPWAALPLQDCVNLSAFLVRATIAMQGWTVDLRGVGGAVDVAIITRTGGFKAIEMKEIFVDHETPEWLR